MGWWGEEFDFEFWMMDFEWGQDSREDGEIDD
jgi:hypothetical protein